MMSDTSSCPSSLNSTFESPFMYIEQTFLQPFDAVLKVLLGFGKNVTDDLPLFTAQRKAVSNSYQRGVVSPGKDYSRLQYQCAYIFLYFPCHTVLINQSPVYQKLSYIFSLNEVNVCSIGGGPGTDFFGLALLGQQMDNFPKINGIILELYTDWQAMFGAFRQACPSLQNYIGDVHYVHYDFYSEVIGRVHESIHEADLVTMVKFLSEVYKDNQLKAYRQQLQLVFNAMKVDSRLLIIDNAAGSYRLPFVCIARNYLDIVYEDFDLDFNIREEHSFSINRLNRKFGFNTKENAPFWISIWKKKPMAEFVTLDLLTDNGDDPHLTEVIPEKRARSNDDIVL